jgi:transcriptional regulator with XRE-family HTH domain
MDKNGDKRTKNSPGTGDTIRALRKRVGLTLSGLSARTGLSVSALSRLENGLLRLSWDKMMVLSVGLGVDMARLLDTPSGPSPLLPGVGRRVVHRAGEGRTQETGGYNRLLLATEIRNKHFNPILGELNARTIEEFLAEFGALIRHPGDAFALVLEGEVELHTELYAPLRLRTGDSVYFDGLMGHAYLKGSEQRCRIVVVCSSLASGAGA